MEVLFLDVIWDSVFFEDYVFLMVVEKYGNLVKGFKELLEVMVVFDVMKDVIVVIWFMLIFVFIVV